MLKQILFGGESGLSFIGNAGTRAFADICGRVAVARARLGKSSRQTTVY